MHPWGSAPQKRLKITDLLSGVFFEVSCTCSGDRYFSPLLIVAFIL